LNISDISAGLQKASGKYCLSVGFVGTAQPSTKLNVGDTPNSIDSHNPTTKSKYDLNNNIKTQVYLNPDGQVNKVVKYEYTIDTVGNWINCIKYENEIPKYMVEREITYF